MCVCDPVNFSSFNPHKKIRAFFGHPVLPAKDVSDFLKKKEANPYENVCVRRLLKWKWWARIRFSLSPSLSQNNGQWTSKWELIIIPHFPAKVFMRASNKKPCPISRYCGYWFLSYRSPELRLLSKNDQHLIYISSERKWIINEYLSESVCVSE